MNATQFNEAINELKQTIYSEIHHRILWKYSDKPLLKDEQLFFLLLPFFNGAPLDENMKSNVVSAAIVHASIDEHEKIKEVNENEKLQQLTVLAGDYYSGIYYDLLANGGNIALIRALSKGIVRRCEQHIKIYEHTNLTLSEIVEIIEAVQSELISQFYSTVHCAHLNELMKTALTIVELHRLQNGTESLSTSNLLKNFEQLDASNLELTQLIEARKQHLKQLLQIAPLNDECKAAIEKYCLS